MTLSCNQNSTILTLIISMNDQNGHNDRTRSCLRIDFHATFYVTKTQSVCWISTKIMSHQTLSTSFTWETKISIALKLYELRKFSESDNIWKFSVLYSGGKYKSFSTIYNSCTDILSKLMFIKKIVSVSSYFVEG